MTSIKTTNNDNILKDYLSKKENQNEAEKKLEAALLIEKVKNIDTEKGFRNVMHRIERKSRIIKLYQQFSKIAAIFVIPLLFVSVWLYLHDDTISSIDSTEYTVHCPVGTKTQLSLPDGSFVWLNSGTTIKYHLPFETKTRQIKLSGEAYFSVEKSEVPFLVHSANTAIKVYGTEFNVKAYDTDSQIKVALKEGNIGFSIFDKEDETQLIPNDFLVYNKHNQHISKINKNISKHIAWRDNLLVFDETPLAEMALTLERWYGIDVEVKDTELLKYKFTATFENESLLQVIELLELSSPIKIDYIRTRLDEQSNIISKAKIIINQKHN